MTSASRSANRSGRTPVSHGVLAMPSPVSPRSNCSVGRSRANAGASTAGTTAQNASTAHIAPLARSNRPWVTGLSYTGGSMISIVRSPASNVSPKRSQRIRRYGRSNEDVIRATADEVVTSVACGQAASTLSTLPLWSESLCETNTQRTSCGSTRPNTASSHWSLAAAGPVSTRIGCAPRITIDDWYMTIGSPTADRAVRTRNVSGTNSTGS